MAKYRRKNEAEDIEAVQFDGKNHAELSKMSAAGFGTIVLYAKSLSEIECRVLYSDCSQQTINVGDWVCRNQSRYLYVKTDKRLREKYEPATVPTPPEPARPPRDDWQAALQWNGPEDNERMLSFAGDEKFWASPSTGKSYYMPNNPSGWTNPLVAQTWHTLKPGDWVVELSPGKFTAVSHMDFCHKYLPSTSRDTVEPKVLRRSGTRNLSDAEVAAMVWKRATEMAEKVNAKLKAERFEKEFKAALDDYIAAMGKWMAATSAALKKPEPVSVELQWEPPCISFVNCKVEPPKEPARTPSLLADIGKSAWPKSKPITTTKPPDVTPVYPPKDKSFVGPPNEPDEVVRGIDATTGEAFKVEVWSGGPTVVRRTVETIESMTITG